MTNLGETFTEGLMAQIATLTAERDGLLADKARLDYLEAELSSNPHERFDRITALANQCSLNHAVTVRGLIDRQAQEETRV